MDFVGTGKRLPIHFWCMTTCLGAHIFYLHDITRGKEEQVFRIENGKQVFISNFGK